jgi:nitrilase
VTDHEEILFAEIDPENLAAARREFDPVGHYARPDVFHLTVDTSSTGRSPSATANGGGPRGKLQVARGCA